MRNLQFLLLCFLAAYFAVSLGSPVFNCPAPRSPDNGLSFIFQDGRIVRFRCHPGFKLVGRAEANCENNQWDSSTPECHSVNPEESGVYRQPEEVQVNHTEPPIRALFTWEGKDAPYGVGPRRLPLINGLWKPSQADNVLSIGSEHPMPKYSKNRKQSNSSLPSKNGGKQLIKQELRIAEIRHKQQQEVRRSRPSLNTRNHLTTWRQEQIKQARQGPTILYAGSRSASAYRGDQNPDPTEEIDTTPVSPVTKVPSPIPVAPAPPPAIPPTPTLPRHNRVTDRRQTDPDIAELRRRQIEQILSSRIHGGQRSSNKGRLIEDARRHQYSFVQSIRDGNARSRSSGTSGDHHYQSAQSTLRTPRLTIIAPPLRARDATQRPVMEDHQSIHRPLVVTESKRAMSSTTDIHGEPKSHSQRGAISRQFFDNRHLFSQEKAAQVDATVRQFLTPIENQLITDSLPQTPSYRPLTSTSFTGHPREQLTPAGVQYQMTRESPPVALSEVPAFVATSSRRQPLNLPPVVRNTEKSGQTQEALYQQYLQAEHLRRILDYETAALHSTNRRAASSTSNSDSNVRRLLEDIYHRNDLRQADLQMLTQLSPDLQVNYLRDVLTSRGKEASETHLAEDFMRRYALSAPSAK